MSNVLQFPKTRTQSTDCPLIAVHKLPAADCGGTLARIVLIELASYASAANRYACFPCIETLCKATGLGASTIRRQFKTLENLNLISRESQYRKGLQTVNKYHLSLNTINEKAPANGKKTTVRLEHKTPSQSGSPALPEREPRPPGAGGRTTNRTTNRTKRATPAPYTGPRCTDNEAERATFERLTQQPQTTTEPQAAPINKNEELATIRALIAGLNKSTHEPAPTSNP